MRWRCPCFRCTARRRAATGRWKSAVFSRAWPLWGASAGPCLATSRTSSAAPPSSDPVWSCAPWETSPSVCLRNPTPSRPPPFSSAPAKASRPPPSRQRRPTKRPPTGAPRRCRCRARQRTSSFSRCRPPSASPPTSSAAASPSPPSAPPPASPPSTSSPACRPCDDTSSLLSSSDESCLRPRCLRAHASELFLCICSSRLSIGVVIPHVCALYVRNTPPPSLFCGIVLQLFAAPPRSVELCATPRLLLRTTTLARTY
mmetsp:Transcript_15156/g.45930  ORF Transcript_15156/g.45930 Transcript_15156/m.45930 type:complete len:258 (+) Transcript_15156:953-1726(+)